MADIRKLLETKKNGLRVNLFEFDIDDEENFHNKSLLPVCTYRVYTLVLYASMNEKTMGI